ncbi:MULTISPECIES: hypothetical protein [unclassified Desulfovibrio]|uniref:hypothetical protein n=1 Tax=unclassified Desulfovibrio TaxID=2593640 RepID=UPI000F5F9831|nr:MULTISPECIES: hypothetical protein [unclassified Desulfovibrio]RRD69612.1 hypothetical protein EII24_09330 [Desulfovibrio sp. OH1209_COT-279]RRD86265.1 hypothetical protein EII23_09330 [Desulfovibrio sp. OH1186_COT-070]
MYNRFGTTAEMVIQPVEEKGETFLLAIDSRGLYMTTATYVDRPSADRNRFSLTRENTNARLVALGLDPDALWKDNQHRIQAVVVETRKVNPLKASKRGSR